MRHKELYWDALTYCRGIKNSLCNKAKPLFYPIQQRRNNGIYAVNINARVGLFAQLNWCLRIFSHCERLGLRPCVYLTSPFYTRIKGDNWLDYFFENLKLTKIDRNLINSRSIQFSNVSDVDYLGMPADILSNVSLEHANHLFWSNLTLRNEIMDYVDSYTDKYYAGRAILGLHFRGTDKKSEARPVAWEYAAKTTSSYLDENPSIDTIFVASDEQRFVEWIKTEFKGIDVISHNDTEYSIGGKAIHTQANQGDNYMKGKEALVNSLLLSKCNVLIRTSSFLSAWSSVFNPSLPIIMLNRPYIDKLWFPDSLLLEKSMDKYLPNKV